MGKETDLWDDSALVNAFDNAMTKYKVMHSTSYQNNPTEEEKVISGTDENGPATADETMRDMEQDNNNNNVSNSATESCAPCNSTTEPIELRPIQENPLGAEPCSPKPYMHSSTGPHTQETFEGNSNLQSPEYTQLLSQYYELEEQRQKVLQQLHQASLGNYQSYSEGSGFGSCAPWNASTSQEHQAPSYHSSCTGFYSSCYPYSCHCLPVSWPSTPCAVGGQWVATNGTPAIAMQQTDPMKGSSLEDDNVVKIAMGAAEKAISSMKGLTSMTSNSCEEKGKEKESSIIPEGQLSKAICSETDLTEVLNAWYSAGFYMGKYLSEQSIAKNLP
ncbi:uncharacterized protein LOC143879295 [Tasmannia lanceolata]|uniref:uncharacterized protein LOC143879295 n=1 Tax=Tasmannia lanceolata TaxID=3420 RepID=UPI0040629CD6